MLNRRMKSRHRDTSLQALAALLICPAVVCGFLTAPCAAEPNDVKVELHLEGKGIEHLVLLSKDQPTQTFENPGQTIKVAPGKYRVNEVRLKGGYIFRYRSYDGDTPIEADTNEPAVLRVGGPLRQNLTLQRRGGCLVLSHELVGLGGEKYPPNSNRTPPQFTVYRGDTKIKSGQFEYG